MYRSIGLLISLLALSVVFATSAAAADFTNCRGTAISPPSINSSKDLACYEFNNSDAETESGLFFVRAVSALITLDPDTLTAGVQAAQVDVMHCPGGVKAATGSFTCEPVRVITGASLTGLAGISGVQNRSIRVGPGAYYIDVIVEAAAGDTAVVAIQGE